MGHITSRQIIKVSQAPKNLDAAWQQAAAAVLQPVAAGYMQGSPPPHTHTNHTHISGLQGLIVYFHVARWMLDI